MEEPLIEGKQLTDTEIEEIYRQWGAEVHKVLEPFLKHIINRCVEVMVREGHISDKQIENIVEEKIR